MEIIHGSVTWYQQKIGSYDKQLWEQSVEQKVLKGIQQAPRRTVKPKTELIDVDLVRGSTFSKAKPQVPWTYITLKTFSRVVLFPCHYRWWIQQTSIPFWVFLLVLYCLQIFTISVFVCNVEEEVFGDEHSLSEVFTPCILMVLLGLIHSQTVLTHLKPPVRDNKRDSWRRKRSLSQNRSGSDLVGSPGNSVGSDGNSSQSKTSLKTPLGSRLLRDRTKDRKARSKSGTHRTTVKAAAETNAQDSESAYHTYEESAVDKGSSADQDTVRGTSKKEEGKEINVTKGVEGDKERGNVSVDIIPLRESQESDLPEDSNSDEDKESEGGKDNSKRFSQSISSDNDLDMDGIRNVDVIEEGQEAQFAKESQPSAVEKNLITNNISKVEELNTKDENKVYKNGTKGKELNTDSVYTDELIQGSVHNTKDVTDKDKNKVVKSEGINMLSNHCSKDLGLSTDSINGSVHSTKNSKQLKTVTCSDLSAKVRFEGPSRLLKVKGFPVNGLMDKSKVDINTVEDKSDLCDISKSVNNSVSNDNKFTLKNLASRTLLNKKKEAHEKEKTITSVNGLRVANDKTSIQSQSSDFSSLSSVERGQSPVPAHIASFVHFTLDKKREVTPRGSREGTPTHTQSDILLQAKHSRGGNVITKSSDSESEDIEKSCKTLPNVRRRKVTLPDGSEVSGSILRNRRQPASLGIRETKSTTTVMSSSEAETEGQSSEYSRESRKNMASSEEWGDHLQSGLDSTSESSSCGSEPEISTQEVPEPESEIEAPANPVSHSVSSSTAHVINLLHPTRRASSSQSTTHNPPDKVTCIIWEGNNECKKIELTAIDIGWAIIETVHKIPESSDYVLIGITFSILMGLTPLLYHSFHAKDISSITTWGGLFDVFNVVVQNSWRVNLIHLNGVIQRLCLSAIFFFMLSVADKTFKQRLLYAKHFCYLTSSRRARKFDMPHFRLNKVRNIRTWLSLRSYLKKRGPQRSVDVIVSSSFLITLIMLILICLQLLRDTEIYLNYLCNWELLAWCMALGVYLLRFMNLGLRINKKYRNLSVLITEQINLYLQMEQKPHKKEELMVANNVLKLAESLLKELESPFKISGISANPLVLNVTRVVVLSAFSAVLTELLGFKLKLYKIKLRP